MTGLAHSSGPTLLGKLRALQDVLSDADPFIWRGAQNQLVSLLPEIVAQIARGDGDTARIEWMQSHLTGASDSERYLPFRVYWGAHKNIRSAIDRAIKDRT
jgi:hypothetical protein